MPFVEPAYTANSRTANDIIEEVRRMFLSGQHEEMNQLDADIDDTTTSVPLRHDMSGIRAGAYIGIDMEMCRVWSVSDNVATVQRGVDGSAPAAHYANDLVDVNPKLPRHSIFKAINDELLAVSAPSHGLFAMKTFEFDSAGPKMDYALPDEEIIDVYSVRQRNIAFQETWSAVSPTLWRWNPNTDVDTFGSGQSLHLPYVHPATRIQVLYRVPFTTLVASTDDIAVASGMPARMQDILPLGAMLRLGPIREIKRNFTESQSDARRAEEVPANAVATSFAYVRNTRKERIDQEAQRLALLYPEVR